MSRGGKPSGSSTLEDFYKHVPSKVREDIKNKLLEAHVNGMDGFIEATQYIIAQLISGNIAPEVANAAKGYMELMFTAVSAKMIHDNESGSAKPSSVMSRVAEAKKRSKRMIPQYTIDVEEDGTVKTSAEIVREGGS
tara:strand:+ start:1695 stop:2105 length:411 start_codon:yes stop_codon:yes gene_type:complete